VKEATASCLYLGHVMHRRVRPVRHRFVYRVFCLYADIDELPALDGRLRLFGHNRWNVVSFLDRDHGPGDASPLRPWIEGELAAAGLPGPYGAVRILCFPRLFGYVFNPLSIWFCHDPQDALLAVLYEVNNSFGDRHCYLIPASRESARGGTIEQSCAKLLHVSPFAPMQAHYRFRLEVPSERLRIGILQAAGDGILLAAAQTGRRQALTAASLRSVLWRYPLMTLKVIAAIHWEAFRLWRKKLPVFRRPSPPTALVTSHPLARGTTRT
jgi:DUF1365 family protein